MNVNGAGVPRAASTGVLVVGMHRSGTSAVTRVLNLHGVELGDRLLPPAADNRRGFWEHRDVVALHERLLQALGRSWKDPRPLPEDWSTSPAADRARAEIGDVLDRDFPGVPLFGIKDPRLSTFLELWLQAFGERGIRPAVVHVVRHPDEVADSIHLRDGWPRSLARLLWAREVVEAVSASAAVARCAIRFDALLEDANGTVSDLARALDLPLAMTPEVARAVDAHLDPASRHHARGDAAPIEPAYLAELYEAFLEAAAGGRWTRLEESIGRFNAFESEAAGLHLEYAVPLSRIDAGARRIADLERQLQELVALHAQTREQASPRLGPERLLLENTRAGDRVVAYYRAEGQSYSEENSYNVGWRARATCAALAFEVPAHVEAAYLRIDPSEIPGWFDIAAMTVDGREVDVGEVMTQCNGVAIAAGAPGGVSFVGDDNDPYVEIVLPPATARASRAISFVATKRGLLSSFNALAERVDAAFDRRDRQEADRARALTDGLQDALHLRSQATAETMADMRGSVRAIQDALAAIGAEEGMRRSRLDGIAAELGAIRGDHTAACDAQAGRDHAIVSRLESLGFEMDQSFERRLEELVVHLDQLLERRLKERMAHLDQSIGRRLEELNVHLDQSLERRLEELMVHLDQSFERRLESFVSRSDKSLDRLQVRSNDLQRQVEARQAVTEGLLESIDARLREAAVGVEEGRDRTARLEVRLQQMASRAWGARARRLLGMRADVREISHDGR